MTITSQYDNGRLTLHFTGELDHHGAKTAMNRIESLLESNLPRDCVIEMSELTFMDSSGIAVILRVCKRLKESGGRAWVENPSRQPLRVIDASGIDRVVKITSRSGRE